jgi:hypothetical protein
MMFSSPAAFFSSLLFGAIGLGAFLYGKRRVMYKPMVIGFVLMTYPYFVSQTWLLYLVGCALCLALYVYRDWGAVDDRIQPIGRRALKAGNRQIRLSSSRCHGWRPRDPDAAEASSLVPRARPPAAV